MTIAADADVVALDRVEQCLEGRPQAIDMGDRVRAGDQDLARASLDMWPPGSRGCAAIVGAWANHHTGAGNSQRVASGRTIRIDAASRGRGTDDLEPTAGHRERGVLA